MKQFLQNLKSGIIVGIGFLLTLSVGGILYATLSWHNMENVTSGDVLKSSSWNDMVDNIEYLKEQISNAGIGEPAEGGISCNGDYWKILSGTYTRENAVIECLNVGSGRYLPTEEELMNLYYSSCKSNLNFIDDAFYWASTISWDSSRWGVRYMKLNVKAYNYGHNNFSSKYNVICIHD